MEHNKNFYALHAVIFKKKDGWTLDKAEQEVNNYIKSGKKHFYRETSSSYRFRNIPKQKFISKTFRTKNLKNGISLVMGELKPEFHHLEGAGIFDLFKKPIKSVKQFFSARQGFNNTTTKNLNAYGGMEIKRLTIARTPIMRILDKALGLITLGKWGSLKKEYGHDKLFHLALIANLGSKNLVVEKNEVINVNTSFKMSKDTETMDVDLKGKKFNVNQMLEATKRLMGEKNFYSYNSLTNNCQTFIKSCLMSMGLYDAEENNFVFQDLSELSKKVPSISKKIMNATTNLGAVVNKLTGQGEVKRKEITHINQLSLKQLRQLANAFNNHMIIVDVERKDKKSLVEELEKHLNVENGELVLKPHIFELVQKVKPGDIEVEQEVERLKGVLAELNKEFLPLQSKVKEARKELKEKYNEEFEGENFARILRNIETGVYGIKEINELKKKFNQPNKKELIYFLENNSYSNYKKKNLVLPDRQKYKNLKQVIYETEKNLNPKLIKNKLEKNKAEKELKAIRDKQRKIEEEFQGKQINDLGVDLNDLKMKINYLRFTGIPYSSGDEKKHLKDELTGIQKKYKKQFGIRTNDELYDYINEHSYMTDVYNNKEYMDLEKRRKEIVKQLGINPLYGEGKMSLEDEFKMDEKDHEKKLSKLEASNPNKEVIKETLEGLRSITENGIKHIKKLEEMLELEGGSAKSAGFIKAIMARRAAEKEGRKTTRDDEFKNYEKSGFQEQKLNKSSQNLVTKVFKEGVYKKMVLNFAILNEYYLYNTKAIRELYNKDPENAKKAVEEIDEVLGDEKKVLEGLKKALPNYDDLNEVEKNVYLINYKQAVRAKIMAKYFDGLEPVVAETTDEMRERMKQNYIRWYNKNRKSKKPEKGKEYKKLLENIENLEEGEELEIPTPTKGKKETIEKLEEEVKEAKKKRKSEFEPSEDRKALDEALMDFMKRQETIKVKPKKKEADDFEDLLAESGLTMEDLGF